MDKPENTKRRSNEKLYPLVFLLLFPLTGGSAAMEYGLFGGNIATGAFWGCVLGSSIYGIWRYRTRQKPLQ
jgi:hypothetical protein